MENAGGGSLTAYVASKQQSALEMGLYLSEDDARYFFRVNTHLLAKLAGSHTSLRR